MNNEINITDKRRYLEILAVILTGIGKFVFMDWLNWRFIYIGTACILWGVYIFNRYKSEPKILIYWGFRKDTFIQTLKLILPFVLIALLSFFIYGYIYETNILSWHILPLLLLYPIWGAIQQFLIVGLIAGNIKDLNEKQFPGWSIILLTAIVFAIVHYPFGLLIGGTFLLAILYTYVYLKIKNLYVLGLIHGWLGAFFFYTVLERDPFLEVFGFLL